MLIILVLLLLFLQVLQVGAMNTLREARKRKNITQAELAAATGCSQVHISAIEVGRSKPSIALAKKLANKLDINVLKILDLETK